MNLQDVKSGFNLSKMNENFKKIQEAFNEDVLYRDVPVGQPNQMMNDLDMNNHRIYNTTAPKGPYDLVRVIDVQEMGGTVVPGPPPAPAPAPATGTDSRTRIAVIGDSLSGQQNMFDEAWPAILERSLNSSGVNVQVKNFAINAYTYDQALNTPVYGPLTMVQAAIAYDPAVVIVALGANDSFRAAGQGNSAGVIAEAKALFEAVRAGLPDAIILYGSTTMYDVNHINLSNPQNRHILPAWWQKKRSGLLAGLWCKEIQTDPIASDIRTAMQMWTQIDNNARALPEVSGTLRIPLWKVARLGCVGPDGLHPMAVGHKMMHAAVREQLQTNTAFRTVFPELGSQGGGEYNNFDPVFLGLVSDNGSEWTTRGNPGVFILQNMKQFGPWNAELCDSWFYPSKGSVVTSNLVNNRTAPQVWMIRGSKPNTVVQVTGNETSWLPTNLVTDSRGDAIECGSYKGLPNGVYPLRYRVDDETYGPLTLTVTGDEDSDSDYALKDGSNATGTWPISISGEILMDNLRPVAPQPNQMIGWTGTKWAPQNVLMTPGWQMQRESATSIRIFPISDNWLRIADGTRTPLGDLGAVLPVNLSGEFPGGAFNSLYVYYSPAQNRLSWKNVLPTLQYGIFHFPGDASFICLGRVYLNAAGQLEDTESHRGVVSTYNQGPRSIKFSPRNFDGGLVSGRTATISTARFTSCFPGAMVDLSAFGQAGATADASYSRVSFSHDPTATSTLGGNSPTVASHSVRSLTSATGSGQTVNLNLRCESGTIMIVGNSDGVQGRGLIYHNW